MRPLGMPPTPRAASREGLPVAMAAGGGGLSGSGLKATPAPTRRSTSASAACRSWVAAGGGARRTVAVGMMVDSLPDGEDLGGLADDGWVGTAGRLLVPSPLGLLTWEGPSRPACQGTTPFRRVREARPARRPAGASGRPLRAGW